MGLSVCFLFPQLVLKVAGVFHEVDEGGLDGLRKVGFGHGGGDFVKHSLLPSGIEGGLLGLGLDLGDLSHAGQALLEQADQLEVNGVNLLAKVL